MGMYVNPGNRGFQMALNSQVYVDMTGLISYTNHALGTDRRFLCVSRPRRFGKTMAAKMLTAYYSMGCFSEMLFENLEIARDPDFRKHLNRYHVIYLNMQDFLSPSCSVDAMRLSLEQRLLHELISEYPELSGPAPDGLMAAFSELYRSTRIPFIFIIDEWDCLFREKRESADAQKQYLDFLRNLLKDKDYIELVYMTGILPIKKYGTHSALNMFDEYSMMNPGALARFVGFPEQKVSELCIRYQVDFSEMQRWYDGYIFENGLHIYNPKSVVDSIFFRRFGSYWTRTETYEALKMYLVMNFDGLKDSIIRMLAGERCRINPATFQNDMTTFQSRDDILTLLVHLGYLSFDMEYSEVFIPNLEVEMEFKNAVESVGWSEVAKAFRQSETLLQATLKLDAEIVARQIEDVHNDTASILTYNNENDLACVIKIAYYSARAYYTCIREFPSGKGFADVVFLPRKHRPDMPAILVELKWGRSAEEAVNQIKERNYLYALKQQAGSLLLVGISYDRASKTHSCVIEKIENPLRDSIFPI